MIFTDPTAAAPPLAAQIAAAHRILILSHINPDGDAIGSLLGTWHALRALGKEAIPMASPPLPEYTAWMPGIEHVQLYQRGSDLPDVDMVIMVDTASPARTGAIYEDHGAILANLPLAIIDHHVTNEGIGTLNLIRPASASNCELLFMLFQSMHVPISPELATCLMLGVTTDTQSFQTSATKAETLRIAADLLDKGADQGRVVHEVYYALPASSAALIGKALAELQYDDLIAWVTISRAMMEETGAEDESVDEVVRLMQRIGSTRALVMFKERNNGTTKISLRSRPPLDVARLARRWGGGGHSQAAGATLEMPPEQAANEVLPLLRALVTAAS